MARAQALSTPRINARVMDVLLVVTASAFVALCARFAVPLPFTPVPLSLVNFAVLLVGISLGSKRGAAALALYLMEGAAGMPVFSPTGPGGIAQLMGPTAGYLFAYPLVAFIAGWISERAEKPSFGRNALAATAANIILFVSGVSWLMVGFGQPLSQAIAFGLYPFFFGEIAKVLSAAALGNTLRGVRNF